MLEHFLRTPATHSKFIAYYVESRTFRVNCGGGRLLFSHEILACASATWSKSRRFAMPAGAQNCSSGDLGRAGANGFTIDSAWQQVSRGENVRKWRSSMWGLFDPAHRTNCACKI